MTTHANSTSREYQAWWRMKQNCQQKNYPGYRNHGAKGITFDLAWSDFIPFLQDMGEMPTDCNALIRLDPKIHYCKHNCKWGFVRQGRPRVGKEKPAGKVTKKKRLKDPHTLCMTIEKKHYEYIARMALLQSQESGKIIHPNDIIRDALVKAFPCPELYDLFGARKK